MANDDIDIGFLASITLIIMLFISSIIWGIITEIALCKELENHSNKEKSE